MSENGVSTEPMPTYSNIEFNEYLKWKMGRTGIPERILAKVRIVQLDQYSYEPTGIDSVQYWVDRYKKEGKTTKYDSNWYTYAFKRDVNYARDKSLPISLPEKYSNNVPFAYDGGYIIVDDDNNIQIMTAAKPNEKSDTFGDFHDQARQRLESRTGKKISDFKAAQRCYVVHTYNHTLEKVVTLIIPIVSTNRKDTQQFLGNRINSNWPDVWESTYEHDINNGIKDITSEVINANSSQTSKQMVFDAEDRYSKALAREWMLNQSDLEVRFVTGDDINEWAQTESSLEQNREELRVQFRAWLSDPAIEKDEACRMYMRKLMFMKSKNGRELLN